MSERLCTPAKRRGREKAKKAIPELIESITDVLCRESRLHPTRDADDGPGDARH
jgi:hypothetical protein